MLQSLYRHVLLPSFETGLKGRKTFRYWRELERSQWLDHHSLRLLQLQRLRDLLSYAAEHCDYYRQKWLSKGLLPEQVQTLSDFSAWPLVDRDVIRDNRFSMRSRAFKRLITKSTGGSSGVPLTFDLDPGSNDRRTAAWHRGYDWASAGPGSRQFYLWGVDLRQRTRRQRLKESLWNRLHRKTLCSSFGLSRQNSSELARRIKHCRPDAIVAYVKPLYELARCLDEQSIRPFSPKSIVVGAEKLHTFERELIERVFQSPVFETYGSREFMLIGAECEHHRGLHMTAEHLIVELLDDQDRPVLPGEEGNVVITDLFNFGMPFIRYRTGDRAVATDRPCACGRALPMLSRIVGRELDVIRTPDGRLIPGEFFPHLIKDFCSVRQFQVVQDAPNRVRLCVIADDGFSGTEATLLRVVRQHLGPMVEVVIERVSEIPLTMAGKRRVVVSNIRPSRAA